MMQKAPGSELVDFIDLTTHVCLALTPINNRVLAAARDVVRLKSDRGAQPIKWLLEQLTLPKRNFSWHTRINLAAETDVLGHLRAVIN